jgi:hypothetical protein
MDSKTKTTQDHSSDNPSFGANTTEEKEAVWAALKKVSKPISKTEFFQRLKKSISEG